MPEILAYIIEHLFTPRTARPLALCHVGLQALSKLKPKFAQPDSDMVGAQTLPFLGILGVLAPGTSTPLPFESPRDYSGYSFVHVLPENETMRELVVDSAAVNHDCQILKTSRSEFGRTTDLFCGGGGDVDALSRSLTSRSIKHEIVAASENRNMELADSSSERDLDFNDYFRSVAIRNQNVFFEQTFSTFF